MKRIEPKHYIPAIGVALLLIAVFTIHNTFILNLLFMIFVFAGMSSAWNIIGGFAGQLSLGHAAFFGLGAYTSSLLFVKCGVPPLLGILGSIVTSAILAILVGLPCFRLKGPFFTLATLSVAEVLQILAVYFNGITDGSEGLCIPYEPGFANLIFESKTCYALVGFVFAAVVTLISHWILNSRLGYQLAALRDVDEAAETLGVDTSVTKMKAFVISGVLTAIGASIYAQYILFLEPHSEFSVGVSIDLALISMVGGLGTTIGPIIGAFILIPLQEFLRSWIGGSYQGLHLVIYGFLLLAVVMFMPQGIASFLRGRYNRFLSYLPVLFDRKDETSTIEPSVASDSGLSFDRSDAVVAHSDGPIISVQDLSKNFGGLQAVSDVSFSVLPGEIYGIIGPNGAGKTTLFNLLSKNYPQSRGKFQFGNTEFSEIKKAHTACRLGIGRTYQLVKPFGNMTVLENVMVGAFCHEQNRNRAREIALEVLRFAGLDGKNDRLASELTLADKKRLEVARALATKPTVLLLDEVMAGLNNAEMDGAIDLIQKIRECGITVILVEHVMRVIMTLSDRIMVLAEGMKVTEGVPEQVMTDSRVIKAYLGEDYEYELT